jgi:hypothetical protein
MIYNACGHREVHGATRAGAIKTAFWPKAQAKMG